MKKVVIAGIIVVLVVVIAAFVMLNQSSSDTSSTSSDSGSSGSENAQLTGETKEFTVRAFQFGYEPDVLEVNKGDKVIIHAYSSDVGHGLAIAEYGINMRIMDSTPVTEEFIADKSGVFSFYCSVPCGSGHGSMKGQLIVN